MDREVTTKDREVTTKDILECLKTIYGNSDEWVYFDELRCGTGFGKDNERRIDFWAIRCWGQAEKTKVSFEIKISRADFLKEMKEPVKRRAALMASNLYYFIAPAGLIKKHEIPYECGLMEVSREPNGEVKCRRVIDAPWRDVVVPTWSFMAAVCRRVREVCTSLT